MYFTESFAYKSKDDYEKKIDSLRKKYGWYYNTEIAEERKNWNVATVTINKVDSPTNISNKK